MSTGEPESPWSAHTWLANHSGCVSQTMPQVNPVVRPFLQTVSPVRGAAPTPRCDGSKSPVAESISKANLTLNGKTLPAR